MALAASSMLADDRDETSAADAGVSAQAPDAAARETYREARTAFVEALTRIESGADLPDTAAEAAEALRTYPLYPYLEAARIDKALGAAAGAGTAADAAARRFLEARGKEPVGRLVRRAWLESLARREQWRAFLDEAGDDATADEALRCQMLRARIAVGEVRGIARDVVDVWLTGRQLPLECEPVFQWLRAEGPLTDSLIEQRIVLLLESNQAAFARVIAGRLPEERAAPLLRWADLLDRPAAVLDELIEAPDTPFPDGALYAGWSKLARNAPAEALARHDALVAALDLDSAERSRYALALALGLAWDRRAEALDYFAEVEPADLDDYALGWLARAALWSGEWRLAADAIDEMSAGQRDETRWRYWAARTAERLGDRSQARELYRSILPRDNYYAAMAAARLGEPAEPHHRPLDADENLLRQLATEPAFVRARELLYARMPWNAAPEWRDGFDALDEEDRLQAIHLAARWGWYDLAIATATGKRVFDDYELLYPSPYDDAVEAAAELTKLEAPLIYGMIRQESLYRTDAASAAGAVGLTQLRPDTARRAARRWNLPAPGYADLFVPEVNVKLGAAELRTLVDEFGGQIPVALAGYNAGPNAARRWLPEAPLDSDIWIENVPYNETRDYVQRVLWHSLVFAWLESGDARDTSGWLARIEPAGDAELHAER